MQASTAIETGVDDDAFAVVVFSQDVRVDGTETVVSHRLDVHVTQSATRPSVNVCRTLFHPAAVEQITERTVRDGDNDLFPAFLGLWVEEGNKCLLPCLVVEQRVVVCIGGDFHAVYLLDDCAGFHPGVGCVEGAFLHHFGNEHAPARVVPVEEQSQAGSRFGLPFGIETAAGVRYVQFAQPFAQQLGKVIIIVDMGQEAAIGGGHLVPVHSVHIGIVESLLLLAVHVVEHVFALRSQVHLGIYLEGDGGQRVG